jgi:hypothetical protein
MVHHGSCLRGNDGYTQIFVSVLSVFCDGYTKILFLFLSSLFSVFVVSAERLAGPVFHRGAWWPKDLCRPAGAGGTWSARHR